MGGIIFFILSQLIEIITEVWEFFLKTLSLSNLGKSDLGL